MIFAWIEECRDEWPIILMCRVLEVSRSGYYAWLARKPSAACVRREELTEEVKEIHAQVKAEVPRERRTVGKRCSRQGGRVREQRS